MEKSFPCLSRTFPIFKLAFLCIKNLLDPGQPQTVGHLNITLFRLVKFSLILFSTHSQVL